MVIFSDKMAGSIIASGTAVRQFSVFLQNRVGALSSVVNLLEEAHVNVIGLSVVDSVDTTVVRMVVSAPDTVRDLFKDHSIPFTEVELLVVDLPEGAASLGRCLLTLLMAEVNIHFSYPLITHPGQSSLLAFHLDDTDFGRTVLSSNGFKVLCQEDLGR